MTEPMRNDTAMLTVTYIEDDRTRHEVAAEEGLSAMEAAVRSGVPGIDGDCGGQAACGTCHVFVDPDWLRHTGTADPLREVQLLEQAEGMQANSRLACQIRLAAGLDGLILRMPASQF